MEHRQSGKQRLPVGQVRNAGGQPAINRSGVHGIAGLGSVYLSALQ